MFFDHGNNGHRIGFLTAQDSREPRAEQSSLCHGLDQRQKEAA
jgi:hypothetical protein